MQRILKDKKKHMFLGNILFKKQNQDVFLQQDDKGSYNMKLDGVGPVDNRPSTV